jgi:hypothetical protein
MMALAIKVRVKMAMGRRRRRIWWRWRFILWLGGAGGVLCGRPPLTQPRKPQQEHCNTASECLLLMQMLLMLLLKETEEEAANDTGHHCQSRRFFDVRGMLTAAAAAGFAFSGVGATT